MSAFLLPCTSGLHKARTMAGVPSHMGNEQPLPDELRCRRCDGKRWRCCGRRLDGVKYCEYHYNKMRIFYERIKGSAKRREGEISSTISKKERASSDHVETKVQKEKKRFKRVLSLVDKPEGSSVKKLKTDNLLVSGRNKVIRSVNKHSTLYGMTIVRPYCFKWPGIYVPVRFAKANGLFNRNCDMEVLDEAGDYWPVKLWAKPYDGQAYIRHGWNDFQQAHGLKIGDQVRFELIKGEEKPILKCCIQRLGSPAAVGELKDCQPLDHGQEVHAESSSSRPQLFSYVQAVDKLLEKEKIAQPCHGSCAAVSKAQLSNEKVTGEIVLERHSSLPVIDFESLDQNSCEAHSSHSEAMDEVGRRSVTKEVHAKSSRARRQLFGQAVKMQSTKEKIAQLHHDSCATASKGHPSKEMVTGEIVVERPCSLPIIEVESLDGNAAEPQSSHTELVDEAGGRSVLKAPLPYTNSEHPAPPGDSPAKAAQDGNSIGSFPLAIPHGDGQSKLCTFQSGAEVEKTTTPVLFETPSAMMIHNSPADNSIKRVDLAEGESKVLTSQSGTEVEKTITSVLYQTPTVMRACESPADYPIVRVELADGENKVLTSQSGREVEKTITAALFETQSAMRVCNSPADNPIDSPVGQNKAPTSQCGTEVDKIISPDLLETQSAMRIYNSPTDNLAKRVEPIDGQSSAPTSECDIEDEKTMLETPLGPIRYNFLTDDPAERVKPIVNMSDTSSSILEAIVSKHGDIGAGCALKSSIVKSALLGSISNVALELHNMKPDDIQSSRLEEFYSAIQDAEGVKIDVNWLRQTLDEISKMKELIKTSEKFEDEELRRREKAKSYRMILQTKRGKIEELQSMMEELQSEVRDAESKLESENLRIDELRGTIEDIKSRSRQVVRII